MAYEKKRTEGVVHLTYKYKLKPRKSHVLALESMLITQQRLYNRALEIKSRLWRDEQKGISHSELLKLLVTQGRKDDPWLEAANYGVCNQTLLRLDQAFQGFFQRCKAGEAPGYPKFKKRDQWNSFQYNTYGNGCKIVGNHVYLGKAFGKIKFDFYRPFPEGASIRTMSVIRHPDGWYVALHLEVLFTAPEPSKMPATGIDLGIKAFVTAANGDQWKTKKFLRLSQQRLAIHQRARATMKMGTNKRNKIGRLVRKTHHTIVCQRREWHRRIAKDLVSKHGAIFYEALTPHNMARKPNPKPSGDGVTFLHNSANRKAGLNKAIFDVGWATFVRVLAAAAEKRSVHISPVLARNTSQRCSCCHEMPTVKITLRVRTYACEHCGHTQDRDHNAARNILALGLKDSAPLALAA